MSQREQRHQGFQQLAAIEAHGFCPWLTLPVDKVSGNCGFEIIAVERKISTVLQSSGVNTGKEKAELENNLSEKLKGLAICRKSFLYNGGRYWNRTSDLLHVKRI
ncbi:MAG: hypothetical protein JXQ83_09040 [Candidatus Glassbacteria bacterium]|nr:hypothetical protein [Candidatus Glassbacteria bacterium]